jgi:hypothetical protein
VCVRRRAWRTRREGRVPHEGRRRRRSPAESARARFWTQSAAASAAEANSTWAGLCIFGLGLPFLHFGPSGPSV